MKSACRGFTAIELLLVVGTIALFLLIGAMAMSSNPIKARSAALELRAMLEAARSLASANASNSTVGGNTSGATVTVTSEKDRTVFRLYVGRPPASGNLPQDAHVPPFVTDAKISVVSESETRPPFAILVSSSGYARLAAGYEVNSSLPLSVNSCPSGEYIFKFSAGMHTEDHPLSCDEASLRTGN